MVIKYKKQCNRCRKNYVSATYRTRNVVCYECEKKELSGEIKDTKMKKMFDIPENLYKDTPFLRSIKINYLRYGKLSEKQISTFKKVVKELNEKK
jgi:hypothetical protein